MSAKTHRTLVLQRDHKIKGLLLSRYQRIREYNIDLNVAREGDIEREATEKGVFALVAWRRTGKERWEKHIRPGET
jgi:sensor histidine kinase regulating citrate/malate metabolism